MEDLFHLFWSVRLLSKLLFVGGFILAGWLIFHCSEDEKLTFEARPAPAVRPDAELRRALDDSAGLTGACIEAVRRTFVRDQIAGPVPGKPPATRTPQRAADLKDARVFEVVVSSEGDVVTFEPTSGVAIHGLADSGLYRRDRDGICGNDDRSKAFGGWSIETAPAILANLRTPKPPPPLVLMYWRWCDRRFDDKPRPTTTCAIGLAWIEQPSGNLVASAVGVGVGKLGNRGTVRERDSAAYLAAMERAEQQVRDTVLGWK